MVGKVRHRALHVFVRKMCHVEISHLDMGALWGRFVMAGVVVVTPARRARDNGDLMQLSRGGARLSMALSVCLRHWYRSGPACGLCVWWISSVVWIEVLYTS